MSVLILPVHDGKFKNRIQSILLKKSKICIDRKADFS